MDHIISHKKWGTSSSGKAIIVAFGMVNPKQYFGLLKNVNKV
jgi:hypothetical protein